MSNSKYDRVSYEYETISIDKDVLSRLNEKFNSRRDLIKTANENEITPYHLTWIMSFKSFIYEIDPKAELDSYGSDHSDSLLREWDRAKYGGNYSSRDIETLKLSEKYLEVKKFQAYLSIIMSLQSGKAKVVKSKKITQHSNAEDENNLADKTPKLNSDIFIVHGHNEAAKRAVASFISEIGLNPVILHEQANLGNTVIEKLERCSDTAFAVVIYTACDVGAAAKQLTQPKSRARQNVVFEHGFFVSRLGRARVVVLKESDVEFPSDLSGLVYTDYDPAGAWKLLLSKEIKCAGFKFDMNLVV